MYDNLFMIGREFVARARKYARAHDLEFSFDSKRGKGSHGLLRIGDRKTVVPAGKIKKGTFYSMLKQPGIRTRNF
jgi:hypothetical protein